MSRKNRQLERIGQILIPYEKASEGPSWVLIVVFMVIFWPVGLGLLGSKVFSMIESARLKRFRSCAAIVGNRAQVDVRELSSKLGRPVQDVMRDLDTMISRGYMGNRAYLDHSTGMLVMDTIETEFAEEPVREQAPQPQPVIGTGEARVREVPRQPVREVDLRKKPAGQTAGVDLTKKKDTGTRGAAGPEDFEAVLRHIREVNSRIEDPGVSASIDRIGNLTSDIFRVVQQKPERTGEVRKFMNYYLPVTMGLLEDYALMEKQSYQGKNIRESRNKIEVLLEKLIVAFEKQLDQLFQTDALDVEADIKVLETMMAKDGLTVPKGMDLHRVMEDH